MVNNGQDIHSQGDNIRKAHGVMVDTQGAIYRRIKVASIKQNKKTYDECDTWRLFFVCKSKEYARK